MKVEIGKEYRLASGAPYRLYCVDAGGKYPVNGATLTEDGVWMFISHTSDGRNKVGCVDDWDLVELTPYADFKIDDKVIVWNENDGYKYKRHFAGVSDKGKALAFPEGQTSWTNEYTNCSEWYNCMKYEGE